MTLRSPQQQPDASLHPQPQRRRRQRRILLLIVGLLVLVGAGGIAWWLFSPLFFHNTSNEANPFARAAFTSTSALASPTGSVTTPV